MPIRSRTMRREQAARMRAEGEPVTLLISNRSTTSRSTSFSVVAAEEPEALSADTQMTIYARVTYAASESVTYGEAGRVKNLKADIACSADEYFPYLKSCYAVQLQDGTILRKTTERLSENKTEYVLSVSGYLNMVE